MNTRELYFRKPAGFTRQPLSFECRHCHYHVVTDPALSGVQNRNHCPYCLWSRHLDLYEAGDRLCACKAVMRPVGLTLKRTRNKYSRARGELMLVHQCTGCNRVSINRLAADDNTDRLPEILRSQNQLADSGISLLTSDHLPLVQAQLFGCRWN